tara:strand:- start:87 stop:548 length:462 start_codon:yes stop_codon:yes gene_type:complete
MVNIDEKLKKLKSQKVQEDKLLKEDLKLLKIRESLCKKIWETKIINDKKFIRNLQKIKDELNKIKDKYEVIDFKYEKTIDKENYISFMVGDYKIRLFLYFSFGNHLSLNYPDEVFGFEQYTSLTSVGFEEIEEFKVKFLDKVLEIFEKRSNFI